MFNSESIITIENSVKVKKEASERAWRNAQFVETGIAINRINGNSASAVGTLNEWYAYEEALRQYPQQPDFPNGERPQVILNP